MSGIAVLGAGAFGTALAIALSREGEAVTLVAREDARGIQNRRENGRYLPGVAFPDALSVAEALPEAAEIVLLAVPMQALSGALDEHRAALGARALVACCKGVDLASGRGATALIGEACPEACAAVLTGPSFAVDIAEGLPTALTLACADEAAGKRLQEALSRETLRLYLAFDVIGAELGGALKNVVALAAGVTIGAGLGESARASVVTRGFAEMQRVAKAFGADPATLTGLSGLGDLVLTATSEKSRNYAAGLALGAGRQPEAGRTIEGIATARAVAGIAAEKGIDAPLTRMVAAVTQGLLSVSEARDILLARPLRTE